MTTKSRLYLGVAALAIAVVLTGSVVEVSAQQSAPAAVAIDNDDIGGVVTGANGPEAGVWVIAETNDLPTRYAKMVVTDDLGKLSRVIFRNRGIERSRANADTL